MKRFVAFLTLVLLAIAAPAQATDFTSSNFILRDPVTAVGAAFASSSSFQYFSSIGQLAIGENVSASFGGHAGFLYFPTVTTPVVSATAGDGKVTLNWTAAVGSLGFNVTTYEVGQSISSGGPYTFTNVGLVLSSIRTGLTNGTPYYFVIRAIDAEGDPISTSAQVSGTSVASGGGGGGGGGGTEVAPTPSQATVGMYGLAYPMSQVYVLIDGVERAQTIAGPNARFSVAFDDLATGKYLLSLYAVDPVGRRSVLFSFTVELTAGTTTDVGGIFLAPTIDIDKVVVPQGENVSFFGVTVPISEVTISVHSQNPVFVTTNALEDGTYFSQFNTAPLEIGQHLTAAKSQTGGEISEFGEKISFQVVDANAKAVEKIPTVAKGDLNNDGRVNLVDFSILAYWYHRPISQAFLTIDRERLNGDGVIDLTDFSILAYYWTG